MLSMFLIFSASMLMIGTFVLAYFFFRDSLR